jgi:hypothetical protein
MGKDRKENSHMNYQDSLTKYRKFLESVPLSKYREELKGIKWVEQDLPKEILPLASIFRCYWEERIYFNFEEWFEKFWEEINTNQITKDVLKSFKKYYFDKENNGWFKKGFRARMYRTWISVLTQLDFCYMFEYASAKENKNLHLICNAELDAKGIDAKVNDIGLQIAKISQRKEARPGMNKKGKIIIPYAVYRLDEMERLSKSAGVSESNRVKYKKSIESFHKHFISLKNGFVVFAEDYVNEIVKNIDDVEELKKAIDRILLELSGES